MLEFLTEKITPQFISASNLPQRQLFDDVRDVLRRVQAAFRDVQRGVQFGDEDSAGLTVRLGTVKYASAQINCLTLEIPHAGTVMRGAVGFHSYYIKWYTENEIASNEPFRSESTEMCTYALATGVRGPYNWLAVVNHNLRLQSLYQTGSERTELIRSIGSYSRLITSGTMMTSLVSPINVLGESSASKLPSEALPAAVPAIVERTQEDDVVYWRSIRDSLQTHLNVSLERLAPQLGIAYGTLVSLGKRKPHPATSRAVMRLYALMEDFDRQRSVAESNAWFSETGLDLLANGGFEHMKRAALKHIYGRPRSSGGLALEQEPVLRPSEE